MKISLSICAKEVSSTASSTLTLGNYFATVTRNDDDNDNDVDDDDNKDETTNKNNLLGQTNIDYNTQNPTWTKAIIFDWNPSSEEEADDDNVHTNHAAVERITISIYKHTNTTIAAATKNHHTSRSEKIATQTFRLMDIWNTIPHHSIATTAIMTTNTTAKDSKQQQTSILTSEGRQQKGIIIAVHMEEKSITGSFQLKLHGSQLENLDGKFGKLSIDKSDPFYEIKNNQGITIYTSEVIDNDLNPKWNESSQIPLNELVSSTDDDFMNAPIQIVIMDEDLITENNNDPSCAAAPQKRRKMELIGVVTTTLQELITKSKNSNHNKKKNNSKDRHHHLFDVTRKAKLTGKLSVESINLMGLDNASNEALEVLERKGHIEIAAWKATMAQRAKKYLTQLETISHQRQEKALAAAKLVADIQSLAKEKQDLAQNLKVKSKTQGCTGTIEFQLRGKDLPDLDGLIPGWGTNKSDPFFEVYGYNGAVIYKSKVIRDNLNPQWETVTLDLNDLTHGNLDSKIRITIYDQDPKEKREYIGQVLISINSMLQSSSSSSSSSSSRPYDIKKGLQTNGNTNGQIIVEHAKLINYVDMKCKVNELKQEAHDALSSSYAMNKLSQSAAEAAHASIVETKKAEREALLAEKEAVDAAITVQELLLLST